MRSPGFLTNYFGKKTRMKPKIYFKYLIDWRRLHKAILFKKSQAVSVDISLLFLNFTFIFLSHSKLFCVFRVAVCNVIMKTAAGTSSIIIPYFFESKHKLPNLPITDMLRVKIE